jgi:hypothetical protein
VCNPPPPPPPLQLYLAALAGIEMLNFLVLLVIALLIPYVRPTPTLAYTNPQRERHVTYALRRPYNPLSSFHAKASQSTLFPHLSLKKRKYLL